MSKLYFYYGAMNSSKSANLLTASYNYNEKGMKTLLLKPSIDTRSSKINSRIGISSDCLEISSTDNLVDIFTQCDNISAVFVDECQFLTTKQVDELSDIVDIYDTPVLCYGLRTDSNSNLFSGSERLLAISDKICEIKGMCWCGKKSTATLRINDSGDVVHGEQINIGDVRYKSVCRKHYKQKIYKLD